MMKFTPKYTVSYKGVFHKAGVPFEIDGKDAGMMAKHGMVEASKQVQPVKTEIPIKPDVMQEPPIRKGGRPRKVGV